MGANDFRQRKTQQKRTNSSLALARQRAAEEQARRSSPYIGWKDGADGAIIMLWLEGSYFDDYTYNAGGMDYDARGLYVKAARVFDKDDETRLFYDLVNHPIAEVDFVRCMANKRLEEVVKEREEGLDILLLQQVHKEENWVPKGQTRPRPFWAFMEEFYASDSEMHGILFDGTPTKGR